MFDCDQLVVWMKSLNFNASSLTFRLWLFCFLCFRCCCLLMFVDVCISTCCCVQVCACISTCCLCLMIVWLWSSCCILWFAWLISCCLLLFVVTCLHVAVVCYCFFFLYFDLLFGFSFVLLWSLVVLNSSPMQVPWAHLAHRTQQFNVSFWLLRHN